MTQMKIKNGVSSEKLRFYLYSDRSAKSADKPLLFPVHPRKAAAVALSTAASAVASAAGPPP
jgi:hypothetical protein